MGGGRRRSGGGGSSSLINDHILRRRIESCKHRATLASDLAEYLQSNYPDYARLKRQPFLRRVQETLERMPVKKKHSRLDNDDEDGGCLSNSRKKSKRGDDSDDKLLRIEKMHIDKRRSTSNDSGRSSSSSESDSESEEDDDDVGEGSTSEDAVFGEKLEPKFDLMKEMLRGSYSESRKAADSKLKQDDEKILELEVASNKETKLQTLCGSPEMKEARVSGSTVVGGGSSIDVKGKGGPRFKDLGGMDNVLEELKREVIVPLLNPLLPQRLGVRPVGGILLHGPPGCGKTTLARAIANEAGVPFYQISATEVVSGVSGASEENIRELFSKAYRTTPSIVFIDEIDAIASKRENLQRAMEQRIVTQLITCMGESKRHVQQTSSNSNSEVSESIPGYLLVIGATNRPDSIDPALRRPGRFDREITLGVPDENARLQVLSVLTQSLTLEGSFDLMKIARITPGFVGADLEALADKAGNLAMKRIIDHKKSEFIRDLTDDGTPEDWWKQPWLPEEVENLSITMADFEEAAKLVQPSSKREGFSAIPNVKWENVGGLDHLRREFDRYIVRRIKCPEDYAEFGVNLQTGFLLYGPPGCGKTLIAKAVANEAGASFIHIKGPELLNKYVGESELAVRTLFTRARTCAPCILFFDEVDALTKERGREGGHVGEQLLNQLLIELDGAEQRKGVFVIGATNRPEVMDRAVLRPGRFGKLLYVPLPSADERGLILKALAKKKPIDTSVDLSAIGCMEACENFSGADLAALMDEAAMLALEEKQTSTETSSDGRPWTIKTSHFEQALWKVFPSVSDKQNQYYKVLSQSFKAA